MQPRNVLFALGAAAALLATTMVAAFGAASDGQDHAADADAPGDAPLPNGTLVVVVNATGGDVAVPFNATGGGGLPDAFVVDATNGTGSATFEVVPNDSYALLVGTPAGWRVDGGACDNGAPDNLTVASNATTTCWFDLTKLATLVVVKHASGGEGTFAFRASGPGLPAQFNLTTENGTARVAFDGLDPDATYTLAEDAHPGWNLTAAACDAGAPDNLTLAPGQVATCTFANARLNALLVRVLAEGGDATFAFNATGGGGLPETFNLTTSGGEANVTFEDLDTNRTYALAIAVPAGWRLDAAACDQDAPDALHLDAGEGATCTFNLTKLAVLHVAVHATGAEGAFVVTTTGGSLPARVEFATANGTASTTLRDVAPGTHGLAIEVPAGWRLDASACDAGEPANLTLAAGAEAACWFNLTRLAEIHGIVYHDANRNGTLDAVESGLDGWIVYLDADGDAQRDADETNATTGPAGSYAFRALEPGTHVVRAVAPAGWVQTAPATGNHTLTLAAGGVASTADFGFAQPAAREDDAEDAPRGGKGIGFWKNWDRHQTFAKADLDAWLADVGAASAWLMPDGYAADTTGMTRLIEDATKQCPKRFGHDACAQKKLEAHHLALRMSLRAGLLAADAGVTLDDDAAAYLGLPTSTTAGAVADAIDATQDDAPDRRALLLMKDAAERALGEA